MTGSEAGRPTTPRDPHLSPPARALLCLVAVAICWVPHSAVAQKHAVHVIPDRKSVSMGEQFSVRVVVEGRADSVKGPDLSDFNVLGKSTGTSISIVNNQVNQKQTIDLTLSPRRPGDLTIGKVRVIVAGDVAASSKPVKIRVGGQAAPQAPSGAPARKKGVNTPPPVRPRAVPPSSPPGQAAPPPSPAPPATGQADDRKAFLEARAPDRPLYAGEPVYVEYVLFAGLDIPVQGVRVETPPELKGFVVEQLVDSPARVRQAPAPGSRYQAHVQWRGTLAALEPGEAILDPMTVTLFVGDFFSQRRYRLSSEPVRLEFKVPPVKGRPADYVNGTVGRFAVSSVLDKERVEVGDSAILTVEVAGTGNLRAVKEPAIRAVEGLRVSSVPTADLDELVIDQGGISGKRTFQYLLTPEREGSFEIGRVSLPFFNSLSGRYERTRTPAIRLTAVGGGAGGPSRRRVPDGSVVRIIARSDLSPAAGHRDRGIDSNLILAGLFLPLAFYLGVEIWRRRRDYLSRNQGSLARRAALRKAEQQLSRLSGGKAEDPAAFWAGLDDAVRGFLDARFGFSAVGMTHEEIRETLQGLGAPSETAGELVAEMEACAFGRFAPSAAMEKDREGALQRIRGCLKGLDKVEG